MSENTIVSNRPTSSNPDIPVRTSPKFGGKVQHFALDIGAGGAESLVDPTNPMPVTGNVEITTLTPIDVTGDVTVTDVAYATILDEASSTITYIGKAPTGSATASSVWQIQRVDSSSGLVIQWADGDAAFNNVWNNRAALPYS